MRFTSLGSGSSGNGLVVEAGTTRVLLDCGFGLHDTFRRLARRGIEPDTLNAILITHEHSDHAGGAVRLARRLELPLWLSHGTHAALGSEINGTVTTVIIDGHGHHALGDLEILPYTVPHDAREPLQFVFGDGASRLGVLTDAGCSTAHMEEMLSGCDALVLECNHDQDLLWGGRYPKPLKERVAGRFGHLSNTDAARLLASLDTGRLQHVIAAHLSQDNNRPELAQAALAEALGCAPDDIAVAGRDDGFDWRSL